MQERTGVRITKSILGKRKYQDAMGYENEKYSFCCAAEGIRSTSRERSSPEVEDPEIQQQKLDIKYEKIPNFSKELFETYAKYSGSKAEGIQENSRERSSSEFDGLQQISDWFSGYNEYLQSKYSISMFTQDQ